MATKSAKMRAYMTNRKSAKPIPAPDAALNPAGPARGVDVHPELLALLGKKTIGQVHRETGISLAHVSRIFGKGQTPSLKAGSKIASCLGVSLDRLSKALEAARERLEQGGAAEGGQAASDTKDGAQEAQESRVAKAS